MKTLSIIIPMLNEEENLARILPTLRQDFSGEILAVDGGSEDDSAGCARDHGCVVLAAARGRARQMNAGVAKAAGELLLFLHADTSLPQGFCQKITAAMAAPDIAAGAFSLAIDSRRRDIRFIAAAANLRARYLRLPYGDQAIFTSRENFVAVGGYPVMPIMEDYVFIERLQRLGRIAVLPEKVTTSARRWENLGVFRSTLLNQCIVIGYKCGISPSRLASWYQRRRGLP